MSRDRLREPTRLLVQHLVSILALTFNGLFWENDTRHVLKDLAVI